MTHTLVLTTGSPDDELKRLHAIEDEYRLTLRVLAVVAERLLQATKGKVIEVSDQAIHDSPDLIAVRDTPKHCVLILVER